MTFRGFIAVDVPRSPALDQLAADLRRASPSLKVVDPAQVHLTVKFLGETEEGLVPEIVTAMREATAGVRPFEIRVRGTGAFPNLGRMRKSPTPWRAPWRLSAFREKAVRGRHTSRWPA